MELDWTPREIIEWRKLLRQAPKVNWLQTITHAKVLKDHLGKHSRFAAIKVQDEIVGIFAVQEAKVGLLQLVELFRGPIWFSENPPAEWLRDFASAFAKEYPKSPLRKRRWLPEWQDSPSTRTILRKAGFKETKDEFETIWIDLAKSLDDIRASMDPKWRGHLNKGLRQNLDIRIDRDGTSAEAFVHYHEQERLRKNFTGRSCAFMQDEIKAAATFRENLILWALIDDEPIASILILMHGSSASYRAGWTSDQGRNARAHHVLLWEAITMLKAENLKSFDLGGTTRIPGSDGFVTFKKGMGGDSYRSAGVFG